MNTPRQEGDLPPPRQTRVPEKVHVPKRVPADPFGPDDPLPKSVTPREPEIIDRLLAGTMTPGQVVDMIMDEAYGPLKQFSFLPKGFEGRELEWEYRGIHNATDDQLDLLSHVRPTKIIDPSVQQIEAINLMKRFQKGDHQLCEKGDPFKPRYGANFRGKPGCGKTHIMSAYARYMHAFLEEKLKHYRGEVVGFVQKEYLAYQQSMVHADQNEERVVWNIGEGSDDSITAKKHPGQVFREKLDAAKQVLAKMSYQPSDFLYIDFESLCEMCSDKETRARVLAAIPRARVMFLDDVNPENDPERAKLVLQVIEGRYAAGQFGTFITTNLTPEELSNVSKTHAAALESRCAEMFYEIDFADSVDWRVKIRQRRITSMQAELRADAQEIFDSFSTASQPDSPAS